MGEAAGGVGASVVCEGQQGTLGGEAGPGPVTRGICAPWLLRLPLRIIVIPHHWGILSDEKDYLFRARRCWGAQVSMKV